VIKAYCLKREKIITEAIIDAVKEVAFQDGIWINFLELI
jgi:hypothetical protein